MSEKTKALRAMINAPGSVIAPCAYDCISLRAIELAGFKVAGTTGYGMHGAMLGSPDNGLLAFNEMVAALGKMADSSSIPVMADAEGGYGNALSVIRTVREFEKAGMAGLFIEDQKLPPNCPFIKQTEQISVNEMIGKIKAALDTRVDPDFIIVARTDAPFEESVRRANLYLEAGADMVKVLPKTKEEFLAYPKLIHGPIHMGLYANKGINDGMNAKDVEEMSEGKYKILTFPMTGLYSATAALIDAMNYIIQNGTDEGYTGKCLSGPQYQKFIGVDKYKADLEKYVRD